MTYYVIITETAEIVTEHETYTDANQARWESAESGLVVIRDDELAGYQRAASYR